MKKKRKFLGFISIVLGLILTVAPYAHAVELVISENGAGSESEVQITQETETTITQTNEANIANEVNVDANTGENSASDNTGGDVAIQTGDIKEEISVENSVNSTVVEVGCCPGDLTAEISGNGADSNNEINLESENETLITVNQIAYITNNIQGNANTGENTANDNTGGSVAIDTGNIYVSGGIVNGPINSANISGGSGWGSVSAKIKGNGANSENEIEAELEFDSDIFLNFESYIDNFINWDLNTGRNDANGNSGNVSIVTGDIFFDFLLKNGPINIGIVDWGCCDIFDPGEPPGDEEPPPDVEPPEHPGDNGGEDNGEDTENGDEDGEDEDGELLAEAAAIEAGGPGIVGLSDTSSEHAQTLFFLIGIAMILSGAKILAVETNASKKKNSG